MSPIAWMLSLETGLVDGGHVLVELVLRPDEDPVVVRLAGIGKRDRGAVGPDGAVLEELDGDKAQHVAT